VNIELDGMSLIQHVRDPETGATRELRSVYNIDTSERRGIVEHKIPGLEGGVLQDLGREPVRISFDGIFYGEAAKGTLERLRSKFKMGTPMPFNSDITGAAEVTQVLIEELSIEDVGGITNRYKYSILLREYLVPREPVEEAPPSQEEEAEEAVEEDADDALGSKNYVTGKVVDTDGNPHVGVAVKITWEQGEYTVKTNEEGIFRKDKLDPEKYIVSIDAKGYEGVEKEVIIKSGTEKAEVKEKKPEQKTK